MALNFSGGGRYLLRSEPVISAYPFLISAWYYLTSDSVSAMLMIGQNSNDNRRALLETSTSPKKVTATVRVAASVEANATVGLSYNTWQHASGHFVSNTLREALMNGASMGTSTTDVNPGAPTRTTIGCRTDISLGFIGNLAELSVWDTTGLSAATRRAIDLILSTPSFGGKVPNPLDLNSCRAIVPYLRGRLVGYWPLYNPNDGHRDYSGNSCHMERFGTGWDNIQHPSVIAPPMRRAKYATVDRVKAVRTPQAWRR